MIETEIRGILNKEEYNRLIKTFEREGKFKTEFTRLNLMYSVFDSSSKMDLRCRVSEDAAELIIKKGEQSSADRKEIEVKFNRDSFINMVELLSELGYNHCIASLRHSVRYMYKEIEFTLVKPLRIDNKTADDRNCIYYEAELMASENTVEKAKQDIINVIKSLNIKVLREHSEEAHKFGGGSMVSSHSFYKLIEKLNENFNTPLYTNRSTRLVDNALKLIPDVKKEGWVSIYKNKINSYADLENYYSKKVLFKKPLLNIIRKYANHGNKSIIESGCGTAILTTHLAQLGYNAIGLDNDLNMLSFASDISKTLCKNDKSPIFILADLTNTGYIKDVDVIFSNGVLEHFDDSHIVKILESQISNAKYVIFSIPSDFFKESEREYGNERFMSRDEWRSLILLAGGKIIEEFEMNRYAKDKKSGRWVVVKSNNMSKDHEKFAYIGFALKGTI